MKALNFLIDTIKVIFVLMIIVMILAIGIRAFDTPVIFKDINGQVCSCAFSDTKIPSKEECRRMGSDEMDQAEVVQVGSCQEERN